LALAGATLYLPTRRACRLARDLFLDVTEESAAILPRIVAIGDVDEDEIAFAEAATGALAAEALAWPPASGGLERRLLLAQLVLKWAESIAPDARGEAPLVANNPASALALADDLARLMDDMTTRGVAWDQLDGLVPETLDRYWQLTLEFLQIARENWPQILAQPGAIDPAPPRHARGAGPRRADQGRGGWACRGAGRARDGRRLDRLHAGDRRADRRHRQARPRRRRAARPRPRARRGILGPDRRPRRWRRSRCA